MLRALVLTITAAAAIGFTVSTTPANARIAAGPATPAVESNKVDVRCHHHRHSSRWHCRHRHHHHVQPYPYYQPFYVQPYYGHHHHHHHHRRHRHHHH